MADGYERIEGVEVGQYVAYRFFRVDPAWRRLPIDERTAGKEAFADVVDEFAGRIEGLRAYSTVGVRPEADFFLWTITQRYDDLLELGAALNGTPLAGWLETPYSYLGTTKPSVYTDKKRIRQGRVAPRNAPYLVIYPFVKRRPWYFLTFEERANAMREHAEVGGKFVTITNHTTYSFGIDDQEFIPAFEAEEPADFMHLMMTLRETEASRWTERDTPIFVGKLVDVRVALDALDGAVDRDPERRGALPRPRRNALPGAVAVVPRERVPQERDPAADPRLRRGTSLKARCRGPLQSDYPLRGLHVAVLAPPDAEDRPGAAGEDDEEHDGVGPARTEPEHRADVEHRDHDRAVERPLRERAPHLDVGPALAPEQEEEERDREEEGDPEQRTRRDERLLEREDHDHE